MICVTALLLCQGLCEEFFEMLTWAQLGLHKKPIAVLNTNGFYDALIVLLRDEERLLKEVNYQMLLVSDDIEDLIK
jgi:predicted Rossmann-fold nucleotide-binding protein